MLAPSPPDVRPHPSFRPTRQQVQAIWLMGDDQTHTCGVGGSRSGKTFTFVRAIIIRALTAPGSRHLMVRFRANALRASVWLDTYPKVMRLCFPHIKSIPHRMDGFEELPGKSQIWFGGLDEADRVEKILGQEYATIYAGECSQIPYSSILVLRTRLAQPGTGLKLRGFYDLNPTSIRHWTNVEFGEKRDPISRQPLANPGDFARFFMNPHDNEENLDPKYLKALASMPKQYRERFYEGKYVVEIDGALWTTDIIEGSRLDPVAPDKRQRRLNDFKRISVGVDPSGAQSKSDIKSDEIGIVVAGKTHGDRAVVLEDATMRGSPKEWGQAVIAAYRRWSADVIVAEANYGGAMVESTIQAVDATANVKLVNASRGKVVRAEPVAALFESGKAGLAGNFPELEDQLCLFSREGYKGDRSPDRADGMMWAVSELMLGDISTYTLAYVR